jgi:hypothetical protein
VSRALLADVSNGWIPSGFGQLMHLKWVEMCVGGVSGSSGAVKGWPVKPCYRQRLSGAADDRDHSELLVA